MSSTFTYAYSYAYSVTFIADNMRNALRDVIRENGLDPMSLMVQWDQWISRGVRAWLESRHLTTVVIEFYRPGATEIMARWDFPIEYTGSGADDDMWLDKTYLRQLIAKAARPTRDCLYRVVLRVAPGAPSVPGISDTSFLSTGQLSARHAGTIVATGHITASASYWR
jgi:hypothetical protein